MVIAGGADIAAHNPLRFQIVLSDIGTTSDLGTRWLLDVQLSGRDQALLAGSRTSATASAPKFAAAVRFVGIFAGIGGTNVHGDFRYSEFESWADGSQERCRERQPEHIYCRPAPKFDKGAWSPFKISDVTGGGLYLRCDLHARTEASTLFHCCKALRAGSHIPLAQLHPSGPGISTRKARIDALRN